MSEMSPETPEDPFIPPEADDIMSGLNALYVAAIRNGFTEQRAFELINNLFINQMATLQMIVMSKAEREG
jgi:hypothetical protein